MFLLLMKAQILPTSIKMKDHSFENSIKNNFPQAFIKLNFVAKIYYICDKIIQKITCKALMIK